MNWAGRNGWGGGSISLFQFCVLLFGSEKSRFSGQTPVNQTHEKLMYSPQGQLITCHREIWFPDVLRA